MCKYCVLTPKKALPCMNTRLLVYRMSKSVQQPKRSVRGKILRTSEKETKKQRKNRVGLAIWGEVPPGAILAKCGQIWWT